MVPSRKAEEDVYRTFGVSIGGPSPYWIDALQGCACRRYAFSFLLGSHPRPAAILHLHPSSFSNFRLSNLGLDSKANCAFYG
jgi:hypothetical protein